MDRPEPGETVAHEKAESPAYERREEATGREGSSIGRFKDHLRDLMAAHDRMTAKEDRVHEEHEQVEDRERAFVRHKMLRGATRQPTERGARR